MKHVMFKYIRSHIFECIVAENCLRLCSLCKERGDLLSGAAMMKWRLRASLGSFLSGAVEYSVLLGLWRFKVMKALHSFDMFGTKLPSDIPSHPRRRSPGTFTGTAMSVIWKLCLSFIHCHVLQLPIWLHCLTCARAGVILKTAWNMNWILMDVLSN